ncbi:CIC11C00000005108 [Sungouiella intermedia]|uniref:CIC11C00000005108 n=1 Tax=Sungouiella intermedia TaxID=45354 RepID=A0A1L0BAW3_9ASCO|nr:CIC11C00000005108 [[Candida] intermedia]
MDPWAQVELRLEQRDQLEQKDSPFYHAFSQLNLLGKSSGNLEWDLLRKENGQLLQENESLVQRLNLQAMKMESYQQQIAQLQKSVKSHELKQQRLQQRIADLTEEIAEKNRSIQIINDEHLINLIQVNVLKDQVAQLTKEKEQLRR